MSSLRTFIAALRTGETRTTKALDHVVAHRRGTKAAKLIDLLHKPGALKAPLQDPFRQAVKGAPLPEKHVQQCIDGWPDAQKEKIRRALVIGIRDHRRIRFVWGLTPAAGFQTEIRKTGTGAGTGRLTITALTPRSSLRAHDDGNVDVVPRKRPGARARSAAK
jgi:hypothetical protein